MVKWQHNKGEVAKITQFLCVINFLLYQWKIFKSVNSYRSYRQNKPGCPFFGTPCIVAKLYEATSPFTKYTISLVTNRSIKFRRNGVSESLNPHHQTSICISLGDGGRAVAAPSPSRSTSGVDLGGTRWWPSPSPKKLGGGQRRYYPPIFRKCNYKLTH